MTSAYHEEGDVGRDDAGLVTVTEGSPGNYELSHEWNDEAGEYRGVDNPGFGFGLVCELLRSLQQARQRIPQIGLAGPEGQRVDSAGDRAEVRRVELLDDRVALLPLSRHLDI